MPNLLKSVGKAISKIAKIGLTPNAPPQVKSLLEKYGSQKITKIEVGRKPIVSAIKKLIDIVGNEYFDKLFHLFLIITLENGVKIKLERNQRVNFTTSLGIDKETEIVEVPLKGKDITFAELIENANNRQGNLYWIYQPISNNCQSFCYATLSASGLMNDELTKFIKQDTKKLLSPFFEKVAETLTDAAHSVSSTLSGGGISNDKGLIGYGQTYIRV